MPPLRPSAGFAKRSHTQDVLRSGHLERTPSEAEAVIAGRPPLPERAHRSEAEGSGCG
ncbi:MAG: hypothetical protein RMK99_06375 [Anaerolineales bacterium]|nr:hypothetical protein [Anaerolineales bacterium]